MHLGNLLEEEVLTQDRETVQQMQMMVLMLQDTLHIITQIQDLNGGKLIYWKLKKLIELSFMQVNMLSIQSNTKMVSV